MVVALMIRFMLDHTINAYDAFGSAMKEQVV